jgi:hypothetical protein
MRVLEGQAREVRFGWMVVAAVLGSEPRYYTCGNRPAVTGIVLDVTAQPDVLHARVWEVKGDRARCESTWAGVYFSSEMAV